MFIWRRLIGPFIAHSFLVIIVDPAAILISYCHVIACVAAGKLSIVTYWLFHSGAVAAQWLRALDYRLTSPASNPAPWECFIPIFISLLQVVPDPVQAYSSDLGCTATVHLNTHLQGCDKRHTIWTLYHFYYSIIYKNIYGWIIELEQSVPYQS